MRRGNAYGSRLGSWVSLDATVQTYSYTCRCTMSLAMTLSAITITHCVILRWYVSSAESSVCDVAISYQLY